MVEKIGWVLLASVSPISELRGGIPLSILKYELDPLLIFCKAVIANALIFFPVFFALRLFYDKLLYRIPLFNKYLDSLRKHGFTNPEATDKGQKYGLPLAYNEAVDQQSWQAMKAFWARVFA